MKEINKREDKMFAYLKELDDKQAKTLKPFDYYFAMLPAFLMHNGDKFHLKISKQSAHFYRPLEPYQYWAGYMCENPKGDYIYGEKNKLANLAYNPTVAIYGLWKLYSE